MAEKELHARHAGRRKRDGLLPEPPPLNFVLREKFADESPNGQAPFQFLGIVLYPAHDNWCFTIYRLFGDI